MKWEYQAKGDRIASVSALGANGNIILAGDGLKAISADGQLRWFYRTPAFCSAPAIAQNGAIYFAANDGKLRALSADGDESWERDLNTSARFAPVIDNDGAIYLANQNDELVKLDINGDIVWRFQVDSLICGFPAIGQNNSLYFVSRVGSIYGLHSSGKLLWHIKTDANFHDSTPVIGQDGTIYIGSLSNCFMAITPDGSEKWRRKLSSSVSTAAAVSADNIIYVCVNNNKLLAFDPNGDLVSEMLLETSSIVSPVIGTKGALYVAASNGILYCISIASSKAASSWPMFRANSRQTAVPNNR